jgi:lipopolysaccharide transport system ATP-binding protein
MSDPIISVRNLGKKYRLGATLSHNTLRDQIAHSVKSLWYHLKSTSDGHSTHSKTSAVHSASINSEFWALKDISFDVLEGEVVGIIGRNGAGKSTLLKILSQITEPTEGEARIWGCVASLLEIGTGFHPELSGRENIFLNGAILGMTKAEIKKKFDEIVDFAEIEKFIDTPVKRYSSGMYVRLAFAVAAHLEPEILLVDEVLAVGDVEFQKKCLGKMNAAAKGGKTVLFVSHNMAAVRQLCTNGVLLDQGRVKSIGRAVECIESYLNLGLDQGGAIVEHGIQMNADVLIDRIKVNGSEIDKIDLSGEKPMLKIEVSGRLRKPRRLDIETALTDFIGNIVATCRPGIFNGNTQLVPEGSFELIGVVYLPHFTRGDYFLSIGITDPYVEGFWDFPNAVCLTAEGLPTAVSGPVLENRLGHGPIILPGETKVVRCETASTETNK